jgi:hypothetical protein
LPPAPPAAGPTPSLTHYIAKLFDTYFLLW